MFPGSLPVCLWHSRGAEVELPQAWVGGKGALLHSAKTGLLPFWSAYLSISLKNALSAVQIRDSACSSTACHLASPPLLPSFFPGSSRTPGIPKGLVWKQAQVLTAWLEPKVFSSCFQDYFLGNKMWIIRVHGEEMGRSPGTGIGLAVGAEHPAARSK